MKHELILWKIICSIVLLLAGNVVFGQTPTEITVVQDSRTVFYPSHEPKKAAAPFSDIVKVGDLFFLSGQIGMDHTTRILVKGGVMTETTQALENIKAVLAQHELEMKNVVKCTVILSDINDFKAFNEIYVSYFPQKPARTTFAASGLARGAKIEIECIAAR